MIYYGLIHRSLIDKARRSGRVFDGLSPDYHSGVLFARLAERFLSTDVPLSLAGLSGRSNGVAHMRAEQIASQGGRKIKSLKTAKMGVFQITPRNSNDTSPEGISDTGSKNKTIRAVVSAQFTLD